MKTISSTTLSGLVKAAKTFTARAKAVKAWRLRKADLRLQSLDMPKGYIWATDAEANEICARAGKNWSCRPCDNRKHMWALGASICTINGRVEISLVPIV